MFRVNAYAVLNLISALVIFGVGVFALVKSRKLAVRISFFLLALAASIWQLGNFFALEARTATVAVLWCRIAYVGAIFFPVALYHFVVSILDLKKQKWFVVLGYVVAASVFIPLDAMKYLVDGTYFYSWGHWARAGIAHPVFLVYFSSILAVSAGQMYFGYKKAVSLSQKAQMRLLFIALVAVCLGLVDYPAAYGVRLYPFGYIPTAIGLLIIGRTVLRARIMDFRLFVARSFSYAALVAILGGFLVFTVIYQKPWYQNLISQNVALIFSGLAAALAFQPLKKLLQRYADEIFAKERYDSQQLLGKLEDVASSTVMFEDLGHQVVTTITKDMKLTRAALIETGSVSVKNIEAIGYDCYTNSAWEQAVKLADEKGIVVADEFKPGSSEESSLKQLQTQVVVPLKTENKLVGVLALGEKRSGDMFTAEDVKLFETMADELAVAVQNSEVVKEKQQKINQLDQEVDTISEVALGLESTLELDEICEFLIEGAITVTGAENGSIMLLDRNGRTLSLKASRGLKPEEFPNRGKVRVGEGVAGWVAEKKKPVLIIGGKHENEYLEKCLARDDITSSITAPLKVGTKLLGVLSINRKRRRIAFTREHLRLITAFAEQAAEAMANASIYGDLKTAFLGTISALAAAVDAKDHYDPGHYSDTVIGYATRIAREFGFKDNQIKDIEVACRLHDIGKIAIDDTILHKPGKLTKAERKIVEQHPKFAADILKSVSMLKDVIPYILYHHERYDGKGYPTGLGGEAIPLGARIIALIDSYNAMISDRPYRKALPARTAVAELKKCSGAQFDSEVVKVFLKVLEDEKRAHKKS